MSQRLLVAPSCKKDVVNVPKNGGSVRLCESKGINKENKVNPMSILYHLERLSVLYDII